MSQHARRRRGSHALEFAMLVPFLAAITGAVADFSWYLHVRSQVVLAACDGAMTGAATAWSDGIEAAAVKAASDTWDGARIGGGASISAIVTGAVPDLRVAVTTGVDVPPLTGIFLPVPDRAEKTCAFRVYDQ